jgi:predicted porin
MRLLALLTACFIPLSASAEGKLSLNTGFEYSNGDYGAASETEIWMVPIGLKYQNGPMALRLSTAWLRISGPGGITPDGEPIAGGGVNTTEQGMGDVSTSLTWNLLDESKHPFGLDAAAKVKFGTADEKKYLGTGENDYSLQAEVFKPIGSWFPSIKVGHSWKGDPSGIDYRNVWYGSVGADYRLSKTYSVGAYYDRRQKLTANGQPVSEAMAYLNSRLNEHSRLNLYVIGGFSDASPDWGAGASLSHNF